MSCMCWWIRGSRSPARARRDRKGAMSQTGNLAGQAAGLSVEERVLALPKRRGSIVWRRFRENKLAVAGLAVVLLFYAIAIIAPSIARYDPNIQNAGFRS